ncbi:interleukin-12 subunit alpha [Epinephelus lanceolatus]|uniref:interleukin-12 subunit alpha n=1 Tax=Epinephelus lanceolatus TaxID=310571 RepID=UPI001447DBAF|nr:interleukin-12 subunit alpha [Epinephelus lanceolatus]
MAVFNLYFASCALLLILSWRTSTGLPVPSLSTEKCEECSSLFKSLQLDIKGLLNSSVCHGIPTADMEMTSTAETVQACAPALTQNPGCNAPRSSSFSESECLRNIMKDLAHYTAVIESYRNSTIRDPEGEAALLNTTLGIIHSLRKNCSLMPDGGNDTSKEDLAHTWGNDSFSNRQKMCKMMRAFHVRTITFNRAMGYISSGDHRK